MGACLYITFVGQLNADVTDWYSVTGVLHPSPLLIGEAPALHDPVEDKSFRRQMNGYGYTS